MTTLVTFPNGESVTPDEVGGKGFALIELSQAGFAVPPGAILTTSFFAPWFDQLSATPTWATLMQAEEAQWGSLCVALKEQGRALALTESQRLTMDQLHVYLSQQDHALFAVRSSSPDEDLVSASFAGGYETRLGVSKAAMEEAVRHCFLSSLDARVFHYKKEHKFVLFSPRIAVVVQHQIDSAIAGVGFSLNPLTNDYDEAVFDANWGLGESVVAGLATPDHYIIDKVSGQVLQKTLGAKQVTIGLSSDKGTVQRNGSDTGRFTLDDVQLAELTDVITKIEGYYKKPIDIEWAYAEGHLYILQARPITTHVPLPSEMMTLPGERRMLYTDIALSSGFTINAPISPMGLAWMEESVTSMATLFLGPLNLNLTFEEGFWFFSGSRMYQNLSNMLWLASPQKLAKAAKDSDVLMAAILAETDVKQYRSLKRPPWAQFRMARYLPRFLWRMRKGLGATLWAILAPRRAFDTYQQRVARHQAALTSLVNPELSFDAFRHALLGPSMQFLFAVMMSALGASLGALSLVDRVVGRKSAAHAALAQKLKLGFPGNVVTEMGIALFKVARLVDRAAYKDLDALALRISERKMPPVFLEAWDSFMATYGWRGPSEMDIAKARYADTPTLALRQMSSMPLDDEAFDPSVAHLNLVEARRQAYAVLMQHLGWFRRTLLRRVYLIIDLFAGTRDTPKHHNLIMHQIVRQRALVEGQRFVNEGRLNKPEEVFDLTFEDLRRADEDASLDLRKTRKERTQFQEELERQVRSFPAVIDSRGRILRPQRREEKPGELTGMAVSPGKVTGLVKVLHDPHEKTIEKGDVLVAYTTDPGWTPLFATAGAVVLEVGGVLQHGAVVAREYGKPCVVGIDQVTTRLHDGQRVEVDGSAGIVRLL